MRSTVASLRSAPRGAPLRFLVAGGLNTVAMIVLYVLLLNLLTHAMAYSISFAVGLVVSYLLNRLFVFRSAGGVSTILLFPIVYVVQYLVGLVVVVLWVDVLGLPAELASLAAVVVTLPITYALLRWVFVTRQVPRPEPDTMASPAPVPPAGNARPEHTPSVDDQ